MRLILFTACLLLPAACTLSGCGSGCKGPLNIFERLQDLGVPTESESDDLTYVPKSLLKLTGERFAARGQASTTQTLEALRDRQVVQIVAYRFQFGWFESECISGTRMAYIALADGTVEIYLDAPESARRSALRRLAEWAVADRGTIANVRDAKIELHRENYESVLRVDNGAAIACSARDQFNPEPSHSAGDRIVLDVPIGDDAIVSCTFVLAGTTWTLDSQSPATYDMNFRVYRDLPVP